MTEPLLELDVRPTLRAGGEPFGQIMGAIGRLQPGQGLRLLATFKPVPLFTVLGNKGFSHTAREIDGGDWEVIFRPDGAAEAPAGADTAPAGDDWPAPRAELDNRRLDPPEPMVRILAALEETPPGQVVAALLEREPIFLLPELAKRGHQWRGAMQDDGATYRIEIRAGRPG